MKVSTDEYPYYAKSVGLKREITKRYSNENSSISINYLGDSNDIKSMTGFSVFDSKTLKMMLEITPKSLSEDNSYIFSRINKDLSIKTVSLLYKTHFYAIVFENKP